MGSRKIWLRKNSLMTLSGRTYDLLRTNLRRVKKRHFLEGLKIILIWWPKNKVFLSLEFHLLFNPNAVGIRNFKWCNHNNSKLPTFKAFCKHLSQNFNHVIVKSVERIFENSFFKNGKLEFWSEALISYILSYSSNDNLVHNQNMIYTKIVFTNFRENLLKLSFIVL